MHEDEAPRHHPTPTGDEALSAYFAELGRRSGEVRRQSKVDRRIAEIVEAAPTLSREQLDRLAAALRVPNQTSAQAG